MTEKEEYALRVLLTGESNSGKSFYFDKIKNKFNLEEVEEEEGVRSIENLFSFPLAEVRLKLVDIQEFGLSVREIREKKTIEFSKADTFLVFYSVLERHTFDFVRDNLLDSILSSLKNKGEQSEGQAFVLYGTKADKVGLMIVGSTEEKDQEGKVKQVVTKEEAENLCLQHGGLFSVQSSSIRVKIAVSLLSNLISKYFSLKNIEIDTDTEELKKSNVFHSILKTLGRSRKGKSNKRKKDP